MCILQYIKLIGCKSFALIYAWLGGSICHGYMWILLYIKLLVIMISMDLWIVGGSICHWYMYILLYVRLISCNSVPWIYGHLWGVCLPWVYVHSAICETYGVWWCSMDLLSLGWSVCHWWYVHSAICETYLHPISLTYSRIHISACHMDHPNDKRSMLHHYTP